MTLNIDYQDALDFEHCESLNEASKRLSQITNLLNKIISVRQNAKKEILEGCAKLTGEQLHKLSWENKMIRLSELTGNSDLMSLWQDADSAYRMVKAKQEQVYEDINVLKKCIEITPK